MPYVVFCSGLLGRYVELTIVFFDEMSIYTLKCYSTKCWSQLFTIEIWAIFGVLNLNI